MAQKRRHLELCRRGGRFWLLISDGRRFSGDTAAELVEASRGAGDDPLALGATDNITVRKPMPPFAPVLEALHPKDELIPRLEKEVNEGSTWPWLYHFGTRVNGRRWGWVGVGNPTRWQLVPYEFAKEAPCIFHATSWFTESMTGACFSSSVLLRDSVSLEIAWGDDLWENWVAVRYDVLDPWDAARTHLGRSDMGLGSWDADVECPFCTDNPFPGWENKIWTALPLVGDFAGEALVRLYRPCKMHKRCRRIVEIGGTRYVWRYGTWIEPQRVVAWRRALRGRRWLLPGTSSREGSPIPTTADEAPKASGNLDITAILQETLESRKANSEPSS